MVRRFQGATEAPTTYIRDALRLCSLVDSGMSEADKVRYFFKLISETISCAIAPKSPETANYFIAEVKKYQKVPDRRILKSSYQRFPVILASTHIDVEMAAYTTDVVCKEAQSQPLLNGNAFASTAHFLVQCSALEIQSRTSFQLLILLFSNHHAQAFAQLNPTSTVRSFPKHAAPWVSDHLLH